VLGLTSRVRHETLGYELRAAFGEQIRSALPYANDAQKFPSGEAMLVLGALQRAYTRVQPTQARLVVLFELKKSFDAVQIHFVPLYFCCHFSSSFHFSASGYFHACSIRFSHFYDYSYSLRLTLFLPIILVLLLLLLLLPIILQ
jgi:hypothetical protein